MAETEGTVLEDAFQRADMVSLQRASTFFGVCQQDCFSAQYVLCS